MHDEHTKYSKTVGFKPFNGAWQDGDMEKWTGGARGGEVVFSEAYTPTKNVGGNTANKFSSGRSKSFEFEIPETGDYVLSIYTNSAKNADFILAMPTLKVKSFAEETGIKTVANSQEQIAKGYYDLQGRKMADGQQPTAKGIYIVDGKKVVIK